VLIAKNIEESRDLTNLKEVYFEHNLTIVFENPKEAYKYNAINRFVEHYYFSNNYLSKFIGTYPEKTIQNCLAHRTFDYDLYIVSLITPLEELCSR
jgi:recombinational DNA repair protein RecR